MKKFLPKTKNNTEGFTLVELLVVISIIAILSVVGITIFSSTQKTARDAKRKADIESISKVLEVNYNSSTGAYPTTLDCTKFASGGCPQDPVNSGTSVYTNALTATSYTTCAFMESGSGGNSSNSTFGSSGTTYYCKKSQQ